MNIDALAEKLERKHFKNNLFIHIENNNAVKNANRFLMINRICYVLIFICIVFGFVLIWPFLLILPIYFFPMFFHNPRPSKSDVYMNKAKIEKYLNILAEEMELKLNQFLKNNNIKKAKIKDINLIETNINHYNKEIIQYYCDNDRLVIFSLPIYQLTISLDDNLTYYLPYWSNSESIKIKEFKANDIENYTYYGNKIVETIGSGGGTDFGGALIGGLLFGGLGAILGSREEINIENKITDLREVQINFKDNKMINIKGFEIYKDLLCYFPNKELNNKKK